MNSTVSNAHIQPPPIGPMIFRLLMNICRSCRLGYCSVCLRRIADTDNIEWRADRFVVVVMLGLC